MFRGIKEKIKKIFGDVTTDGDNTELTVITEEAAWATAQSLVSSDGGGNLDSNGGAISTLMAVVIELAAPSLVSLLTVAEGVPLVGPVAGVLVQLYQTYTMMEANKEDLAELEDIVQGAAQNLEVC